MNENPVVPATFEEPDFTYQTLGENGEIVSTIPHEEDSEALRVHRETGIDLEFIKTDETGKVISITDPESLETFFTSEEPDAGKFKSPTSDSPDTPQTFTNKLDEVLRRAGFDVSEIEFEDGTKKPISDLTEAEQIDILVQQLQTPQEAPLPDLNEDELNLVEFLRSGKSPRELAEAILETDLSYKYSKMTDEEVYREWLTKERPTFSAEEIEEEITDLRDRNKLGREARAIRSRFEATQAHIPQAEPDVDLDTQINDIVGFAKTVQLDNTIKNDVLNFIIPKGKNEDSELIKYMSTPDALFNMGYMLTQWKNIQTSHQRELQEAEKRGYNKAMGKL